MGKYVRPLRESEQNHSCTFCGAEAGQHCHRKVDGRIAGEPHWPRARLWYAAGLKDGSIKQFGVRVS